MPRAERGFTLLEVIVALAIAALGIAAGVKAAGVAAATATETRERMLATWVAGNRLTELRLTRAWPRPGNRETVRAMGGRTWHLTESVSETPLADLRRVDVVVYTDPGREARETQVYGYVARYRSDEELGPGPEIPGEADGGEQAFEEAEEIPLPGDAETPGDEIQREEQDEDQEGGPQPDAAAGNT